MRLNVSGSAALPDTVMAAWKELSGQVCNMGWEVEVGKWKVRDE